VKHFINKVINNLEGVGRHSYTEKTPAQRLELELCVHFF